MNLYIQLNNIMDYIEKHLEEKIDSKELAKIIGVNEYTFQRIFSLISNISLSEYIRNRRLSNAGQDLSLRNEKIIDLAVKYQYNNATSFSRAFERFHGIKPSEVNKNPDQLKLFVKLHFNENTKETFNIEYKIIEKEQLILFGKHITTNNEHIHEDVPPFFIKAQKQYGQPLYGLVEYKDSERRYVKSYWVLYDEEKQGLEKKIIPKSKYILFRINSREAKDIQEASSIFYNNFLPSCKYNLRDLPELEYYHDKITDFLVPIED